jgi:hypothetical protein
MDFIFQIYFCSEFILKQWPDAAVLIFFYSGDAGQLKKIFIFFHAPVHLSIPPGMRRGYLYALAAICRDIPAVPAGLPQNTTFGLDESVCRAVILPNYIALNSPFI